MADQFANPFDVPLSSEPQQSAQGSTQPAQASSSGPVNPFDVPLASEQTAQPAAQPSAFSRAVTGVEQGAQDAVAPSIPNDHKEALVLAIGGPAALVSYKAGKSVVGAVENLVKPAYTAAQRDAALTPYAQAVSDFHKTLADFRSHDYRNAASSAVSTGADALSTMPGPGAFLGPQVRDISEGARPGADLATPLARNLTKDALLTASVAAPEALSDETASAAPAQKAPSVIQQVKQGESIAQPQAEQALRSGIKSGGGEANLSTVQPQSLRTIAEEPIHALDANAKTLYRQIDSAAGTDFKALNEKLSNTEYQIRQLTDTETDQALEARLEASRTGIIQKIADAKQQALDAGVDPNILDKADAQFTQARALSDVETKVLKNPNIVRGNSVMGSPETVNVDGAVKALQKLQDSTKYGESRLEQALGKDGANTLLKNMYAAQRAGQTALKYQTVAKWIGGAIGAAGILKGISAAASAVSGK